MKGKKQTTAGETNFPDDRGKEAASPRCFFVRGLQESARTSSPIAWSRSAGSNADSDSPIAKSRVPSLDYRLSVTILEPNFITAMKPR